MPWVVKVGRSGNQPFYIGDTQVSQQHAELHISDNGEWMLVDTHSTNGTFVFQNGDFKRLPVGKHCRIKPDDMIRLGPETRFHAKKLVAGMNPAPPMGVAPQKPKQPETVDISNLRRVEDIYKSNKRRLESKLNATNGYRGLTILISILITAVGSSLPKALGMEDEFPLFMGISVTVGAILIITLLVVINNLSKKYRYELEENEKQYSIRFKCPKCNVSFRGKYFDNILSEGHCPKCKTKYVERSMVGAPFPGIPVR